MAENECAAVLRNGLACGYPPSGHTLNEQQITRLDPVHPFTPLSDQPRTVNDLALTGWAPLGWPGQAVQTTLQSLVKCPVCRALVVDVDTADHDRTHDG